MVYVAVGINKKTGRNKVLKYINSFMFFAKRAVVVKSKKTAKKTNLNILFVNIFLKLIFISCSSISRVNFSSTPHFRLQNQQQFSLMLPPLSQVFSTGCVATTCENKLQLILSV